MEPPKNEVPPLLAKRHEPIPDPLQGRPWYAPHASVLDAYNAHVAWQLAKERHERQAAAAELERQRWTQKVVVARQQAEATQRAMVANPTGHFLQWLRQP
jgi:hypothetical protein